MLKKIIIVACILLVVTIPIVLKYSNGLSNQEKTRENISTEIKNNEKDDKDKELMEVEPEDKEQDIIQNENNLDIENNKTDEMPNESKTPELSEKSKDEIIPNKVEDVDLDKQTESQKTTSNENEKQNEKESSEETTSPPKVEENLNSETGKEPEIDEEYLKLMERLFKTSNECLEKGIEISLEDLNIMNTYCQSYGYKGKIIGYELYLIYPNETKLYR